MDGEDKYRTLASISFVVVVILVGLPMWWKTTEVYRFNLPSSNIQSLMNVPIKIAVNIYIYSNNSSKSESMINELSEIFAFNEIWVVKFERIPPCNETIIAKSPRELESVIYSNNNIAFGNFLFIEWSKLNEEILMMTERAALYRTNASTSKIEETIKTYVLQTRHINEILSTDSGKSKLTSQQYYEIIISVLNPRPDTMAVKWNIQMAVNTYLKPFFAEVKQSPNFTIQTQWKYQLAFQTDLKQKQDKSFWGRYYSLPDSSLPYILTSLEKNLGESISTEKSLNIIVYIAPCGLAPIYIENYNGEPLSNGSIQSFISPNWGGIIIVNPSIHICADNEVKEGPINYYLDTNNIMQTMLYHFHTLLDINTKNNVKDVHTVDHEQVSPFVWEYEAYTRRITVINLKTATNTLQSLIKLLDKISYIVINDNVGAAVINTYDNILNAKLALLENRILDASVFAQHAFDASEQAFFDASLLAQLYFPDEQKYAIYIPLFLPIMVPVVSSFSMINKVILKK